MAKGFRKIVVDGNQYIWKSGKRNVVIRRVDGATRLVPINDIGAYISDGDFDASTDYWVVCPGDVAKYINDQINKGMPF